MLSRVLIGSKQNMRAIVSKPRKTKKEVDAVLPPLRTRQKQRKSKRANLGTAEEHEENDETMEIARAVSDVLAGGDAPEEGEEEDTSRNDDGTSCAEYDDDYESNDEGSHESDDSDQDDDESSHESASDEDDDDDDDDDDDKSDTESDDGYNSHDQCEAADDTEASPHSRRASLSSSSKRLGKMAEQSSKFMSSGRFKNKKKWGLKRLIGGPAKRADNGDATLENDEGNDDDLSSYFPAPASNMSASTDAFTRSQSHVSSVVRDIDQTILAGDTTEDNTICTAGRVSIVEDASTAADGDEESTVAFEISTTFPDASSFIRSLGIGPKLMGYDSANDEEEEEDQLKDKNGNALLDVIEEEAVDDANNTPASPPLSIAFSQSSTDHDDTTRPTGTATKVDINAGLGITPLTPSDRTASECRVPVGSPEKITIRREESNIRIHEVNTPKRKPFNPLVGGRKPKAPESPPKRKPRRDHVIVSVFSSSDASPCTPTACAASSSNPFGMCAADAASSEGAWYHCGTGACNAAANEDIADAPATTKESVEDDVDAWTANFDEAFGTTADAGGEKDSNLNDANAEAEDAQPTPSDGSLQSTGSRGPDLEQSTPSTPLNRKSKDLPASPTSVVIGTDTREDAQKDDVISDDLKKVDELDQLISKMSNDMQLVSSIISEQKGKEQSIAQPTSTEMRHRSLVDDIVDDIEDKDEANDATGISSYAVDISVEVPLDSSILAAPSKSEVVQDEIPSVEATVATESVSVTTTTDRASELKPEDDDHEDHELKKKNASKTSILLLSKVFKAKKSTKSPPRRKALSSPPRTKRSALFFRRSNRPPPSRDEDHASDASAEPSTADTATPPVAKKSETFGDSFLSTANALLDQAADYAFPPEEDDAEIVKAKKQNPKPKKMQKVKKEEKAKNKKSPSKRVKNKKSPSKVAKKKGKRRSMARSSSKKRSALFSKHKNDRSERICRIFGDCTDLYNDICNFQEISCMCQDFLCDAQDEAALAVCRVDYAVKKSIRNFGEQCIAVADGEEDADKSKKPRKTKK